MSSKEATGTWSFKPNDNESVASGNILLSEAFLKKNGDREISSLKSKGIDLAKLAELLLAYRRQLQHPRGSHIKMEPAIRSRFGLQVFCT